MAYITSENYKETIYSSDVRHNLKIYFDGVELEDADVFCEKLTISSRIIPNGNNRFSLDNFISKEGTLILHDIDASQIKSPISISIGTLVGDEYEYVPIGMFMVEEAPVNDKNKITIKLRDFRVKFDFNYNAQPVIEENGGSASKWQIFQDICQQAGVETLVDNFLHSEELIGIYDNTIKATTYISYLAEQAGAIPTINREGKLIFVYLDDLQTIEIPIDIVEKYEDSDSYKISRVVYEDAIRKFEDGNENNDTLYINSANPYISSEEQIIAINAIVNGFAINSLKTGKILGNPAIDSYDLIKIVDGDKEFITLATYELTYNGVMIQTFETTIGKEARKENVSFNSDDTWKKNAKTEIDNIKAEVRITTEQVGEVVETMGNSYTKEQINELIQNAESGLTNTFTISGGNNLLRNTAPWYMENETKAEFWEGNIKQITEQEAVSGYAILTQLGVASQSVALSNGNYSVSFKYKRLTEVAECSVRYNGKTFDLNENQGEIHSAGEITTGQFVIEIISSANDGFEIYDLILKHGTEGEENVLLWTQNANESRSDTVQISKGITAISNVNNTKATMDSEGFKVKNKTTGKSVMEATATGGLFFDIKSTGKSDLSGLLIRKVGTQIKINGAKGV